MAVIPTGSGGGSDIDFGEYVGVITKTTPFEERDNKFKPGEKKTVFSIVIAVEKAIDPLDDVDERKWEGEELSKMYTATTGPNSNLLRDARLILRRPDMPEWYPLDTDELVGARIKFDVVPGAARPDGYSFWRNVDNIRAAKTTKKAPPKPVEEDDEDDPFADVA